MSEALIGVVTKAILSKAISLATEEISSLWGVKEELQSLRERAELVRALLSDAGTKNLTSRSVEIWFEKLEIVASDADHLLDEFAYEVLRQKIEKRKRDKVRSFFSSSSNPLAFRHRMANEIKKINLAFDKVCAEANKIGLRPAEGINSSTDITILPIEMTNSFVDKSEIVGRDDEVEKIVNVLTSSDDENNLTVISIVGLAGLGKTCVAKLVCNNDRVTGYFEKTIWVCVSDGFRVERLLSQMVEVLTKTNPNLTTSEALVEKLKEELMVKRFLLVLDDVWNEDTALWDRMRVCLQGIGGSKGSRIVVTTRSRTVASTMQASYIHQLGALTDEESWKLFEKIAFANGGATKTPTMLRIGGNIVKRCGGLPLAIKAIGRLLYDKKHEREWLKIEQSNIWNSSDVQHRVLSVIKLSYDHLPSSSLKQCFAYCSNFPKDTTMERKQLVQLWMAQGLLCSPRESQQEMEDIGNNCFTILLQRSLLQDVEVDGYGSIKSCKMHDLVHDCAMGVSKGHCLTVEGPENDNIKAMHLTIKVEQMKRLNNQRENLFKLRSLFFVGSTLDDHVLRRCKCLNVLVVDGKDVEELPSSIGGLKHLRYLDISRTSVVKLPNSIARLYNLQTLRLYRLEALPKGFENLINLRHMYIKALDFEKLIDWRFLYLEELDFRLVDAYGCSLAWIRKLNSLRTLSYFLVSQDRGCQIEELGYLQNLEGFLTIAGLENVGSGEAATKANLSSKRNVEDLCFCWKADSARKVEVCHEDEDVLEGLKPHWNLKGLVIRNFGGEKLPSWMISKSEPFVLGNLVKLLIGSLKWCDKIPPLGHLPNLKSAQITDMEKVKSISSDVYGLMNAGDAAPSYRVAFPSLESLTFCLLPNLEEWCDAPAWAEAAFPHLKELSIEFCGKLRHIPSSSWGPGVMACLESFRIDGCPTLVSIPSISSVNRLKSLTIFGCPALPAELGLESCTALQHLSITLNPAIHSSIIPTLPKLRRLGLAYAENESEDDENGHDIPWPNPSENLSALSLQGNPKLKCLPHQVQHLHSLELLQISEFDGLKALPEWLGNLRSLRFLQFYRCKNLAEFPSTEEMQRLTNLERLFAVGCPSLEERCKKGSGPEWLKIAHIPVISFIE